MVRPGPVVHARRGAFASAREMTQFVQGRSAAQAELIAGRINIGGDQLSRRSPTSGRQDRARRPTLRSACELTYRRRAGSASTISRPTAGTACSCRRRRADGSPAAEGDRCSGAPRRRNACRISARSPWARRRRSRRDPQAPGRPVQADHQRHEDRGLDETSVHSLCSSPAARPSGRAIRQASQADRHLPPGVARLDGARLRRR